MTQIMKIILLSCFILIQFNVLAESDVAFKNVTDYTHYAKLHNNELKAVFYKWKSMVSKVTRVQGFPDPKLSFSHFIETVETRVGAQQNKYSLMQMFPWFGKLSLKGEIVAEKAKAVEQELRHLELKIRYQVTKAYSKFYFLSKSIDITIENIKLMHYFESVARTRYRVGSAPHSSIIKAQVEIGVLEDKLLTLKTLKKPITEKLNSLLNRSRYLELPFPKHIQNKKLSVSEAKLHEALLFNNQSLKSLAYKTNAENKSINLARKSYFPDFTLGVTYVDTSEALMPNTSGSGKDPLAVGVTINLPIWFSKYSAGVEEASARKKMLVYKSHQKRLNLKSDLEMSLYEYNNSKRKINLYKETLIPKAEQSLQVTREAFESGKVNFLSLIDAERILLEFQLQYHNSLSKKLTSFSKLEMIVGKKL